MWTYEDKEVSSHDDLDPLCTDIVYCIIYTDGRKYIGKKCVRSSSILPVLKTKRRGEGELITRHILRDEKGKIITSKAERKKARARGLTAKAEEYEEVFLDRPFMKYEGSSELVKDYTIERKVIIYQCSSKMSATYLEAMLMFQEDVLFSDLYLNSNILGSFYDNAVDGLIHN